MHDSRRTTVGAASFLALLAFGSLAHAGLIQCQQAITDGIGTFSRLKIKALQKCEEDVVKGDLPLGTDCEAETAPTVLAALGNLTASLPVRCGGNNRTCNAADTGDDADESLASIGWDIGSCPDFEGAGCGNAITDCDDIASCLACIGEAAVDQAIGLYYHALNLPTAASDPDLNQCQVTIGKETVKFFQRKSRSLQKCEGRIRRGAIPGPCPNLQAQAAIGNAEAKKIEKICKECGGANQLCGGGDDFTPADIGFPAECPGVTIPGGGACGGPVTTLDELVACVDCVTEFKADCLDAISALAFKSYPPECNVTPTPTPTPSAIPTPSPTPTTCLNGVLDPAEECDPSAPMPGVCDPPDFCTDFCNCVTEIDCQRKIVKESSTFAQAEANAFEKCNKQVLKGTIAGPCPDANTVAKISTAESRFRAKVDATCGGADRSCGTGDDFPLASIGWDIGSCPDFEGSGCTNAIGDCDGISDCLVCVNEVAMDQAISLYYADLNPGEFGTGSDTNKCQLAIGKETVKFFRTKVKALQKCEDLVLRGVFGGPCPDLNTAMKIAAAESKKSAHICKLCGGPDKVCGGGDDFTPGAIGFASDCPDVTSPGSPFSCASPIGTLQDIVDCVDCVTEFKADCLDPAAVPALKSYPPECNPMPTPTP